MTEVSTILFKYLYEYTQKLKEFIQIFTEYENMCGKTKYISANEIILFKKSKKINPIKRFILLHFIFLGELAFLEKINKNNSLCIGQNDNVKFDRDMMCVAARSGNLNMLKWLCDKGCNKYQHSDFSFIISNLYEIAAVTGHLDIIKWIHSLDQSTYTKWDIPYYATIGGHLDIIKWSLDNDIKLDHYSVSTPAIETNNITILEWFLFSAIRPSTQIYHIKGICNYAAGTDHLVVLKWLHEKELIPKDYTCICSNAAYNGHLHILMWLREKEYAWDSSTCLHAAMRGHIEILKWAIENGCPIDRECIDQIKQSIPKIMIRQIELELPNSLDSDNNSNDCDDSSDSNNSDDSCYNGIDMNDITINRKIYDEILEWLDEKFSHL